MEIHKYPLVITLSYFRYDIRFFRSHTIAYAANLNHVILAFGEDLPDLIPLAWVLRVQKRIEINAHDLLRLSLSF